MKWIFRFFDDRGNRYWEAPLVQDNCKADGCQNITSMVHPYCFDCLPRHLRVAVRPSTLGPNVGFGLFASDPERPLGEIVFHKGDYICPYLGEKLDRLDLEQRYCGAVNGTTVCSVNAPYAFSTHRGFFDGALLRGPAVYTNDARGSQLKNNSLIRMDEYMDRLFLYAMCDIGNGWEILTEYGDDYWNGFKLPFETVYE